MGLNKRLIDQAGGAAASSPFGVTTYTGNQTNGRNITGLGIDPDFVWIKQMRDSQNTYGPFNPVLYDRLRGTGKEFETSNTGNSGTNGDAVSGFITDGFQVGDDPKVNYSNTNTYRALCLAAGGAGVSNTDGSITSSVSAHSSGSFSMAKYTGNNSTSGSVGHGLGVTPEMIWVKNSSLSGEWVVYHKDHTTVDSAFLQLHTTANVSFKGSGFYPWDVSAFSSTTFSLGSNWSAVNAANEYMAYCFASIDGVSKVGTYTGNGSSQTISGLGFQPRFVMIKGRNWTSNWIIFDDALVSSGGDNWLYANLTVYDRTYYGALSDNFDFTSDGFTLNDAGADYNASISYLYLAFA